MPGTRKLGRPTDIRMSMLKGLVTYLLETADWKRPYTERKKFALLPIK